VFVCIGVVAQKRPTCEAEVNQLVGLGHPFRIAGVDYFHVYVPFLVEFIERSVFSGQEISVVGESRLDFLVQKIGVDGLVFLGEELGVAFAVVAAGE